ncbi:hypothetical protein D9Q98_002597 [Chlorella vulgaris]|uniref:Uncharacterized protein n=1 Tax=Chlorella vulgaris TaxID=3077 RepID=A0A9D4TTJ0_CHLVU|nr:hypothetical protein D9Q98_002597 [Chlorella vulgaris]
MRAQLHLQGLHVDVGRICKQAMHQCGQQWWIMPEGNPWSYAPALHTFQRIVELQESWRIMVEFSVQFDHQAVWCVAKYCSKHASDGGQIINTLYGFNAMEVQEAFVKVREQAKALLRKIQGPHAGPQPHQFHQPGLGQPQHQAETINLKAQFFAALGDSDVVHGMFSEALLCMDGLGKVCDLA